MIDIKVSETGYGCDADLASGDIEGISIHKQPQDPFALCIRWKKKR